MIVPKFKFLQKLVKGELDELNLMYDETEIMMRVVEQSKLLIFIDNDWIPVAAAFSIARKR